MFKNLLNELSGRGIGIVIGMILGGLVTFLIARWRRIRERLSVLTGDARDTVVITLHLLETTEVPAVGGSGVRRVPTALRIRSLGQSELERVVPNGHLAAVLLRRAFKVTPRDTLISMEGAEGSYLLETLTNFVCDRVGNSPFDHDLYVMAPCCEPAALAQHQPITIMVISRADLALLEDWAVSRNVRVEHGSDGARVLTLMEMARRFRAEQEHMAKLRAAGQRTTFVETMYILDLALDRRTAPVPTKPIPWGRFESVLKELNFE
ncbi:MAG TPA: hypothetical protein VKD90_10675 [Gemmataceae bacterium]|nr:hypothetical protein [Gemmataceae bacterium]